jgi:hypothetical protein
MSDCSLRGLRLRDPARIFIWRESAVDSKISPPKITIMILGKRNTSMKTVERVICNSAIHHLFTPAKATIQVPHPGHVDADPSLSTSPPFGHCRVNAIVAITARTRGGNN